MKIFLLGTRNPGETRYLPSLNPTKKKAPNYYKVIGLLREIFELDTNSIVELNQYALIKVCEYLKINTPIKVWSDMNIEIDTVNASDEWALHISKALGASMYINTAVGKELFDNEKYRSAGVQLNFIEVKPIPYQQHLSEDFVPNMSIIDILMFCDLEEIHLMLDNYKLTDK
ncbi:WbqC family protein [Flagellimonas marinaquae]